MEQFLTTLDSANRAVNNFVWGPPMLILLLGAGVYLTLRTRFFQLSRMGLWFKSTLFALFCNKEVRDGSDPGSISQFQSFTTALAGTMGTGNIVGVATRSHLLDVGLRFIRHDDQVRRNRAWHPLPAAGEKRSMERRPHVLS